MVDKVTPDTGRIVAVVTETVEASGPRIIAEETAAVGADPDRAGPAFHDTAYVLADDDLFTRAVYKPRKGFGRRIEKRQSPVLAK